MKPFLLARIRAASAVNGNLDQPTGKEGSDLAETLMDPEGETAFEVLARDSLKSDLTRALASLTSREQAILSSYYGIGNSAPRSLEAIARSYRLSRERVRQIRNLAFAKIRRGLQGPRLAQYLS